MIMKTVKQDILSLNPTEYYIAHCVSGDFTLGAGLAKKINETFDMSEKLKERYTHTDGNRCAYLIDNIFNLVTKDYYTDRATYEGLRTSLEDMKLSLYYLQIKKLAIPKLGCGKDKLEWNVVEAILKEVLGSLDLEIIVCVL